jgi:hypothetical protein
MGGLRDNDPVALILALCGGCGCGRSCREQPYNAPLRRCTVSSGLLGSGVARARAGGVVHRDRDGVEQRL